jgi:peptide/nickel transport system substrate-binding protein
MKNQLKGFMMVGACLLAVSLAEVPANTYVSQTPLELGTLDPTQAYDGASVNVLSNLYEGLLTFKGTGLGEFEPALATSWSVTEDARQYAFTLREGVGFHSGNPFTCEDAAYSTSPAWFLRSSLLGFSFWDDESKAAVSFETIKTAVRCENDQLLLTLAVPDASFLAKLTTTAASVLDSQLAVANGEWSGTQVDWAEWIDKDLSNSALNTTPSGTGAYQLVSRTPELAVFKIFSGYWGETPVLENVIIQKVEADATRVLALQNGDADQVTVTSRDMLDQLRGAAGVVLLEDLPDMTVPFIIFNPNANPEATGLGSGTLGDGVPVDFFSDQDVRSGFTALFDAQLYLEQVLRGQGTLLTMALPETFPGYDPDLEPYPFDLGRNTLGTGIPTSGKVFCRIA